MRSLTDNSDVRKLGKAQAPNKAWQNTVTDLSASAALKHINNPRALVTLSRYLDNSCNPPSRERLRAGPSGRYPVLLLCLIEYSTQGLALYAPSFEAVYVKSVSGLWFRE